MANKTLTANPNAGHPYTYTNIHRIQLTFIKSTVAGTSRPEFLK